MREAKFRILGEASPVRELFRCIRTGEKRPMDSKELKRMLEHEFSKKAEASGSN